MRIGLAFVLAACAPTAVPPPLEARAPEVAEACDLAAWQERASSPLRARIAGTEVIVVADGPARTAPRRTQAGESLVLAWLGRDVLVGGELPDDRFDRVVARETGVARAPGGPWLPGVVAQPGLAAAGSGAWLDVHAEPPLAVNGFVPREATGRLWTAPEATSTGHSLAAYSEVLAAPAFNAEQVAAITSGYDVVDRSEDGPPGWQRVEAHTASVRVTGWTEIPRPSVLHNIYDFSGDTVEGDLVRPDRSPPPPEAGPGCIRARPREGAPILGIVSGTVTGRRFARGWLELRLAMPWGRVVGYVRESSAAPRL